MLVKCGGYTSEIYFRAQACAGHSETYTAVRWPKDVLNTRQPYK